MTFFTQFIMGTHGMPRRYWTYPDMFTRLHGFSSVGAYVLGLGILIMMIYLIHSLFKGKPAPSNPWGALTLEWQTSSPPPTANFDTDPVVTHGPYDYDSVHVEPMKVE
jgi:cytochrome c oxidase subunit 1